MLGLTKNIPELADCLLSLASLRGVYDGQCCAVEWGPVDYVRAIHMLCT